MLVRGGTVIDPAQGLHAGRDVRITNGRVAALAPRLARARAEEVVDARGLLVTPGLIEEGTFEFADTRGETLKASTRLVPVRVVRDGVARPAGLQQSRIPPATVSRPFG